MDGVSQNRGQLKTMLSGIQPTNKLTLGNYLGAIKNWVRMQHQYDCFFMIVDLHALTVRGDAKTLADNTLFAAATYLASGIDPAHCTLFIQSHVPQHAELTWLLSCHGYMGELSRMTQFKDKSAKAGANIPVGLFTYPLLMAADILLYNTHLVPVGADQKQHIELTRDIAGRMNNLYGDDTFVVPEPFIAEVGARIMDLVNPLNKMSKSDSAEGGAIFLTDTPKEIEKKCKRATTDGGSLINYSDEQPGVKNLLAIQSAITGRSPEELVRSYEGKLYGHLKVDTATIINAELDSIRKKTTELLADPGELLAILTKGALKAREVSSTTLDRLYQRVGLIRPGSTHL